MNDDFDIESPSDLDLYVADNVLCIGDNILVKPLTESMSRGGIVLPEKASDRGIKRGKVLAVGTGAWQSGHFKPMQVEVGDEIWFSRGSIGNEAMIVEIEYQGEKYLIVSEQIVLLINLAGSNRPFDVELE